MTTATVPRVHPVSQFNDPTTIQDGLNCTPTAFVMLGELATGIRMFPGQFRRLQTDNEGGISIPDGARAWPRAYPGPALHWAAPNDGSVPPVRHGDKLTEDQAWELAGDGYGLVWQGLYAVFEAAGISLQDGFTAGHAVYVDAIRATPRRSAYVIDPLGRPPYDGAWIDWSTLVRYGTSLGRGGIYAAWAAPKLPDTGTEEPDVPGLAIKDHVASPGTVKVRNIAGVKALQIADNEAFGMPAGTVKPVVGRARVDPPLAGGAPGDDRATVYVIGGPGIEDAVILASQVDFTPAAPADQTHTVTVLVDGQEKARLTV